MVANYFFFRIWDNKHNGYLGRDCDCSISVLETIDEFDLSIIGISQPNPFISPKKIETDWNIELYTGLKDKNGFY